MSMWVNNPRSSSADLILTALKVTSDRGTAMGSVDHPIDWEPTPRLVQQVVNRQDVGLVSSSEQALVVGLLGGLAILALHILPVLHSLGLIQPRLENDPRCGVVTGGQVYNVHYMSDPRFGTFLSSNCLQAECWWDCDIRSHQLLDRGQAIADPQCLGDCFSQTNGRSTGQTRERDTRCLSALIEDVTARGTCNIEDNPALELDGVWGWSECTWEFNTTESLEQFFEYDLDGDGMIAGEITIQQIIKGTLSERTEELWKTTACLNSLREQPFIIRRTFQLLLKYSSSDDLFLSLPFQGPTTRNVRKIILLESTTPSTISPKMINY